MRSEQLLDIWYNAILVLIFGSMWIGFCQWAAPNLSASIPSLSTQRLFLYLVSTLTVALSMTIVSFSGPRRASVATLSWRPLCRQWGTLGITALIVVGLCAVVGSLEAIVLYEVDWETKTIAVILGVTVGAAALLCLYTGLLQRSTKGSPQKDLTRFALLSPLPALLAYSLGLGASESTALGAVAALAAVVWSMRGLFHLSRWTPKWNLTYAEANVSSLTMGVTMLDTTALQALSDLHQRGSLPRSPHWVKGAWSLFSILSLSSGTAQWPAALLLSAATLSSPTPLGDSIAPASALASAIVLSMRSLRLWSDYLEAPAPRAFLTPATRHATECTLFSQTLFPQVVSLALLLCLINPQTTLWWCLSAVLTPIYIFVSRGNLALKKAEMGPLGSLIHLPELGMVSTGAVGSVASGWFPASAVTIAGITFGPQFTAIAIAVLLAYSASKFLPALRRSRVSSSPTT